MLQGAHQRCTGGYSGFFASADDVLLSPRSLEPYTHPDGSNDECRLEIHVADVIHVRHRFGRLALRRSRLARLAVVVFVIAVVYAVLSILLDTQRKFAPRVYRFAE